MTAPIQADTLLEMLTVSMNGELLVELLLVALTDVPEAAFWQLIGDGISLWFQ